MFCFASEIQISLRAEQNLTRGSPRTGQKCLPYSMLGDECERSSPRWNVARARRRLGQFWNRAAAGENVRGWVVARGLQPDVVTDQPGRLASRISSGMELL